MDEHFYLDFYVDVVMLWCKELRLSIAQKGVGWKN